MAKEIIRDGRTYEYVASFLTTPANDPTPAEIVVNSVTGKKPGQTLRMGLFFDGTGKNRFNDEQMPDRDISNIAKLHDLYYFDTQIDNTIYRRQYISGVGTVIGEEEEDGFEAGEDYIGLGLGIGPEGGHARIREALEAVWGAIEETRCTEVVFDVFGFSRGASLARHFTNIVNAWPETVDIPRLVSDGFSVWGQIFGGPGYNLLSDEVLAFPQDVQGRVGFLGLFDTVGSFYIPGNDRDLDFNLHLADYSADNVVQLTAYHECRKNFPVTRIGQAGQPLPPNFIEMALPGVHTDVGGGYENPIPGGFENWEVFPVGVRAGHGLNARTVQIAQRDAEQQELYIRVEGPDVILERRLPTRKELAIYSLHNMHEFALERGVPLRDLRLNDPAHIIPEELQEQLTAWKEAGGQLKDSKRYLEGYIHTSYKEGALVPWFDRIKDAPEPGYTRREFHSVAERAVSPEEVDAIQQA